MSNTNAVRDCETGKAPASCNRVRARELEKLQNYLNEAYEETPPTTLAKAIVLQEQLEVQHAIETGQAYLPKGGRPFNPIKEVPPLPSVQLAGRQKQQQGVDALASALGDIGRGLNGGGRSSSSNSSSGVTGYKATGRPGRTCKPREIKPITANSCPN